MAHVVCPALSPGYNFLEPDADPWVASQLTTPEYDQFSTWCIDHITHHIPHIVASALCLTFCAPTVAFHSLLLIAVCSTLNKTDCWEVYWDDSDTQVHSALRRDCRHSSDVPSNGWLCPPTVSISPLIWLLSTLTDSTACWNAGTESAQHLSFPSISCLPLELTIS